MVLLKFKLNYMRRKKQEGASVGEVFAILGIFGLAVLFCYMGREISEGKERWETEIISNY